jgi:hypothetical protein
MITVNIRAAARNAARTAGFAAFAASSDIRLRDGIGAWATSDDEMVVTDAPR